jgi:hypothetical protein
MRAPLMAALATVLLTGCDPGGPTPTPSPTTIPSPTADVRVPAADAYLTALTNYYAGIDPVEKNICLSANTTVSLKSCWSKKLAVQRTFDAVVATITFPADIQADVATLHYVIGRLESSMAAIAGSPDPGKDLGDLGVFSSASVDFLQISSNLRQELGILATPSP